MYFENLWRAFSQMEGVEAIALGGSRAGQSYDEKSDYDLYIYCSQIPREHIRRKALEESCAYMEIGNQFWELEDDCTLRDGVDIDILYRNLEGFSAEVASVVEQHHAHNGYTTCMWYNVLHSKSLYDPSGKFRDMQQRFSVPYPEALRDNIIRQNMRLLTGNLPSYDAQIAKAVKRRDLPSMNHRTTVFLESYFDVLFALNRLPHPGEKRMAAYARANASLLPRDFEENLTAYLTALYTQPETAMDILHRMIVNLQALI